jgi:hypothetical protein
MTEPVTQTTVSDRTRQANILAAAIGLLEALEFYADPNNYFALVVVGDPPCGDFSRDAAPLTEDDKQYYDCPDGGHFGNKAREALAAWRNHNGSVQS